MVLRLYLAVLLAFWLHNPHTVNAAVIDDSGPHTLLTIHNGGAEYNLHIVETKMQDIKIFIPNKPSECCQFLYGKDWKTPLSKSKDYFIDIINNKPMLVRKNQLRIQI